LLFFVERECDENCRQVKKERESVSVESDTVESKMKGCWSKKTRGFEKTKSLSFSKNQKNNKANKKNTQPLNKFDL
jgi:hypothetical protein